MLVSCENILTDAVNVLNVNYFTAQYIHEKNEDNAMLKEYFVEQTEYLKDRLGLSYLGIYGYIDGELMLSGQWMPPADYHVEDRLWYREIIANGTDLTFCNAIYRYEGGKQVLTIGRTMENGTDMVGVDLDIKICQKCCRCCKLILAIYILSIHPELLRPALILTWLEAA